jgi:hypothetical protein
MILHLHIKIVNEGSIIGDNILKMKGVCVKTSPWM